MFARLFARTKKRAFSRPELRFDMDPVYTEGPLVISWVISEGNSGSKLHKL